MTLRKRVGQPRVSLSGLEPQKPALNPAKTLISLSITVHYHYQAGPLPMLSIIPLSRLRKTHSPKSGAAGSVPGVPQ